MAKAKVAPMMNTAQMNEVMGNTKTTKTAKSSKSAKKAAAKKAPAKKGKRK